MFLLLHLLSSTEKDLFNFTTITIDKNKISH